MRNNDSITFIRKKSVLFGVVAMISSLMLSAISFAQSRIEDNVKAIVSSYDYDANLAWGVEYSYWIEDALVDTDYVGLSDEQKASLQKSPSLWKKGVLRIDVSPAWDEYYGDAFDGSRFELEYGWTSLTTRKNQQIGNVRINNCEEIGIYPKSYMYASAMDWWLDEIEGRNEYWQEYYDADSRQWLLEVLIFSDGKDENEIEQLVHTAELQFDVLTVNCAEEILYEQNDVCVNALSAIREKHYDKNSIRIWIDDVINVPTVDFIKVNINNGAPWLLLIPEDVILDVLLHPELYSVYKLDMKCEKDMPWGMGAIDLSFKEQEENAWAFYAGIDDYFMWSNDIWENGVQRSLQDMILLIKTDNKSNEELYAQISALSFQCEFSTEFVGEMWWDGEERTAEPYMRFSVDVEMRNTVL